jgi:hypothetical protein
LLRNQGEKDSLQGATNYFKLAEIHDLPFKYLKVK